MDKHLEAEILATCNALGFEIRGVYEKGTDCVECLKDLLRYLRKDDENHGILRFLGSIRLLETDLLPLLKRYKNDKEISDFTLRLLVALTSPAILLFQEEIPEDKISHNVYLQLVSYLQSYKKAFFDLDSWQVLAEQLEELLEKRPIERSEEDNLILERIFIVIRNILHVPTDELTLMQTDDNMSPQDKILWNIHLAKIDVLILYMCANEDEHSYCLHIVEIISLLLREHAPDTLAATSEQRTSAEKEKDMNALMSMRHREQSLKIKKVQTIVSARFSGVYCVKNMKSLSDKDYISHKLITDLDDVKFDAQKNAKRKPKNRLPLKEVNTTRRSTLEIRLFLKRFCNEFLKAYNKLMAGVKRELTRKSSAEHDDTYYLWAIEYFMKFNRLVNFDPALVSETISLQIFHHIQTQITNYHEMMLTDKKKSNLWSKRMRLGVSAYKELLQTVYTMTKSADSVIRKNADIVVSNVFYVIEYREMLLSLLSNYDEVKFSLTYLSELVESTYMFLKMLENHSKRHSEIIVQKRKRKVNRRRKKKPSSEPQQPNSVENLEEQWACIASNLSAAVQGRRIIPTDSLPFDGASEIPFEEQKVDAMYKIRHALVSKQAEQAVGLLHVARELWPEGDSFGAADIDPEDEFMVLREIFLSNLEDPHPENNPIPAEGPDSREEQSDEEAESMPAYTEEQLNLQEVYKRYASPKVVQPCCLLLANYQNNTPQTNVSLVKFLHRIAWDCKMHALFFQSTVFLTFQKIFQDPDISSSPIIKELYRFSKFIVSKFFEVAQKNNKVFAEFLFWKGTREAYELEEGYGTGGSVMKGAWTEDEEEELKYLYEENKDIYIEGQDVADIIVANINNKKRNKHQVILALKRLGLIEKANDLKPHLRKEWTEDEVIELQNLFEDFKASDDIMGSILNGLSIKRSRKAVVERMLELNLIQDRRELLKKRSKKSKKTNEDDSGSESFINNSDLDDQVIPLEGKGRSKAHNFESSSDDDEANFFRQLKAERSENHEDFTAHDNEESSDKRNGLSISENTDPFSSNKSKKSSKNDNTKQTEKHKKIPKVWEEQEIMQLNTLFNCNRDADNIMDVILNTLTVKRSRQSVIEKLLEVGLIKDKKEVRKKRKTKLSIKNNALYNVDSGSENEGTTSENSRIHSSFSSQTNSKDDSLRQKVKNIRRILSDSEDEGPNNTEKSIDNKIDPKDKIFNSGVVSTKIKKTAPSKSADGQKVRKRPPKLWEEQEIIELQQLFEKYRDSPDIIGSIINELSVKRSKESIIEKLLEVRLIEDRKEIRKKRQKQDRQLEKGNKNDKVVENTELNRIKRHNDDDRKKIKSKVMWDSSDDETLPLNKIIKDSIGTDISKATKYLSQETSHMSESSDDDLPLINVQIGSGDNVINYVDDFEKGKDGPSLSIIDSENEELGKSVSKKKKNLLITELVRDSPRTNENRNGNNKISDDETIPLQNNTSDSHTNLISSEVLAPLESPTEDEKIIQQNETVQLSANSFDNNILRNIRKSNGTVSKGHKRKRFILDDSDESENEIDSVEPELNNSPSSSQDIDRDIETTVPLTSLKKKARILDSDESD